MSTPSPGAPETALRPHPAAAVDRIIVGEAVDVLDGIAPQSVDLVFADPPYNLQLEGTLQRPNQSVVDGVDEAWDRFDSLAAYDAFTRAWLGACRRVLKPDGAIWVIGSYHNIFRVGAALQDLNYWILNDVIWVKTNPMPNFRGRRFTNAHETLIWATREKDRKGYTFNYTAMKAFNDGLQMRSDWTLPICTGAERLKDAAGRKLHPTQKPEGLIYRLLLASTRPGDLVLDPFVGSGTTAAVAKRLGRRFIGIERDPDYAEAARDRVAAVVPASAAGLKTQAGKREVPRLPFSRLLESGLIAPGERLSCRSGKRRAVVQADGTLAAEGVVGSIHQVGAAVQALDACNGWTFWHVERDGVAVPIDTLRDQVRALSAAS